MVADVVPGWSQALLGLIGRSRFVCLVAVAFPVWPQAFFVGRNCFSGWSQAVFWLVAGVVSGWSQAWFGLIGRSRFVCLAAVVFLFDRRPVLLVAAICLVGRRRCVDWQQALFLVGRRRFVALYGHWLFWLLEVLFKSALCHSFPCGIKMWKFCGKRWSSARSKGRPIVFDMCFTVAQQIKTHATGDRPRPATKGVSDWSVAILARRYQG